MQLHVRTEGHNTYLVSIFWFVIDVLLLFGWTRWKSGTNVSLSTSVTTVKSTAGVATWGECRGLHTDKTTQRGAAPALQTVKEEKRVSLLKRTPGTIYKTALEKIVHGVLSVDSTKHDQHILLIQHFPISKLGLDACIRRTQIRWPRAGQLSKSVQSMMIS